jgi:small subunit ribosomal protein S2
VADKNLKTMSEKLNPKIEEMFKAGAQYGYTKTRRHPTVSPFIFGTKNKADIINIEETEKSLSIALDFVRKLGREQKVLLFVGTKPEAKKKVLDTALLLDLPYVTERWVGGIITNFIEIKKRIAKLIDLREKKEKGELDIYTKKERLLIDLEVAKMGKYFGGLIHLKKAPDALFVIDAKKEHIAVKEAQMSKIPVIALCNTDTNIKGLDYSIIANDASVSSVSYFVDQIAQAYKEGKLVQPN